MEISAIVIAGGKSTRMGTNKALLPLDGMPVIERIVTCFQTITANVFIVSNDENAYSFLNVPIIPDIYKEKGPLAGIHAGLMRSPTEINIICACDMPFVLMDAARYMVSVLNDYEAVVPLIDGNFHPLFAVYKKSSLPLIESQLKEGALKIKHFLDELKVRYVEEDELFGYLGKENVKKAFLNMNDRQQYEHARKLLGE